MLKSIADVLKSVAVIVSFLIVIVLVSVVGKDLLWPAPTIESVSLPSAVQQWGYTSNVFAQKISDWSRKVAQNSKADYDLAHPRASIGTQTLEAKIPGSDFTTRSAAQFISDVLALPGKRIVGEVTKVGSSFDLAFRVVGGEQLAATVPSTSDSDDARAIVKTGGELAMKLVDPYTLAASFYNDEKASPSANFAQTLGVLDYMVANSREPYWAHSLKCVVLSRLARFDDAEKECEKATKIYPSDWPAHANFGFLYYSLAQKGMNPMTGASTDGAKQYCRKATEHFAKAEQLHPLKQLYEEWAMCLDILEKKDEASQLRGRK